MTVKAYRMILCLAATALLIVVAVSRMPVGHSTDSTWQNAIGIFGLDKASGTSRTADVYANNSGPYSNLQNDGRYNYSTRVVKTASKSTESATTDTGSKTNITGKLLPTKSNNSGITARAYLVGDIESGTIYQSYNSETALPVASMSKLLTAAASLYLYSPTTTIEISKENSEFPPDQSNLQAGEKFMVKELMYPLLLSSSNVAAEAFASAIDHAKFLELMTGYAREIGMPKTYFADPSGIDRRDTASAKDIFALAKYLYYYHSDILAITKNATMDLATTTDHGSHTIQSTHPFVKDPRFLGGKTGRTPEAGETMLTILNINNRPMAFVVLGSSVTRREADTNTLVTMYSAMKKM